MTETIIKLSECREGQSSLIVRVSGSGTFKNRLVEMGFLKDAKLTIIKYAPLNDPLEVTLNGAHVSLRVEEAEKIEVRILP